MSRVGVYPGPPARSVHGVDNTRVTVPVDRSESAVDPPGRVGLGRTARAANAVGEPEAMIGRHRVFQAAKFAWFLVVGAALIGFNGGWFEPLASPADLPGPAWASWVLAGVVVVLGLTVIARIEIRSWTAAGRRAGLSASGRSLAPWRWTSHPDLTGDVGGRAVRVRTETERVGYSDGTPDRETITVVEAFLDGPADEGVEIIRSDDDRFVARSGPNDLAEAVVTPRARDRLLEIENFDSLVVGDTAESDDPATVGHRLEGRVYDAEELERTVRAVVAVADAFEDAETASIDATTAGER